MQRASGSFTDQLLCFVAYRRDVCARCGADRAWLRCEYCGLAHYCDDQCRRRHFKVHKLGGCVQYEHLMDRVHMGVVYLIRSKPSRWIASVRHILHFLLEHYIPPSARFDLLSYVALAVGTEAMPHPYTNEVREFMARGVTLPPWSAHFAPAVHLLQLNLARAPFSFDSIQIQTGYLRVVDGVDGAFTHATRSVVLSTLATPRPDSDRWALIKYMHDVWRHGGVSGYLREPRARLLALLRSAPAATPHVLFRLPADVLPRVLQLWWGLVTHLPSPVPPLPARLRSDYQWLVARAINK